MMHYDHTDDSGRALRERLVVDVALRLRKCCPGWTWYRIAREARRQAGLRPTAPWDRSSE